MATGTPLKDMQIMQMYCKSPAKFTHQGPQLSSHCKAMYRDAESNTACEVSIKKCVLDTGCKINLGRFARTRHSMQERFAMVARSSTKLERGTIVSQGCASGNQDGCIGLRMRRSARTVGGIRLLGM